VSWSGFSAVCSIRMGQTAASAAVKWTPRRFGVRSRDMLNAHALDPQAASRLWEISFMMIAA
jgi:hypothetical protein